MLTDVRSFVRLALRAHRDPAAAAAVRARADRDPPDWKAVGRLAQRARVAPLLHHAWREETFVPPPLRRRLRRAYLQTGRRNVILMRELETAVRALHAGGVPSIVLKGGALLAMVYRNVALRPMTDVDLLVHREHVDTALAALAGAGFAADRPELRRGAAAAYENQLILFKSGPIPVPLEIHWSLFDSPYYQQHLDLEWLWQTAEPLRLAATTARMLDPIAQLLHLCGHLVLHHRGSDLLWEHDIAELVTTYGPQMDWSALLERAVASNVIIPVASLLQRVAVEDAAPVPAAVVEQVRRLQPSREEQRITGYLTAADRGVASRFWTDLASISDSTTRLGYAWTHLFPSPAYIRARYHVRHPLLVPLYYPYRWLRGLRG